MSELATERVLAQPREVVFAAFTDAAVLARWWGPTGATNRFEIFEPWSGGQWRFMMRTADGAEYAMEHEIVELVAPERFVVRHLQAGHDFTITASLDALGVNRTRLRWRMRFDDPEEAARVAPIVRAANEENLDRLAAVLGGAGGR